MILKQNEELKMSIKKVSLLALLASASVNSYAAPAYRLTDLGVLPGGHAFSQAYSVSENGLISGRARGRLPVPKTGDEIRGPIEAVRFYGDSGYIQTMGTLGGTSGHGLSSAGMAINNDGMVAGYSTVNPAPGMTRQYHAFVNSYKKGTMKDIGTLGGPESRAYGINNNGKVVGWANRQADGSDHEAFVYDSATDSMTGLGGNLLGGSRSFAFDINDKDQIVGTATLANGSAHAFAYSDGAATDLGSLDNSGYSEARAINEHGWVTGWSLTDTNDYHAFIANAAGTVMTDLGSLGGDSKGLDINNNGQVVGSGTDADGHRVGFLYTDGQMYNLIDLLSPSDQAMLKEITEAASINDDGTIVGRASFWTDAAHTHSQTKGFMVSAVPLPGAVFFMGPAMALLGFFGKRQKNVQAA